MCKVWFILPVLPRISLFFSAASTACCFLLFFVKCGCGVCFVFTFALRFTTSPVIAPICVRVFRCVRCAMPPSPEGRARSVRVFRRVRLKTNAAHQRLCRIAARIVAARAFFPCTLKPATSVPNFEFRIEKATGVHCPLTANSIPSTLFTLHSSLFTLPSTPQSLNPSTPQSLLAYASTYSCTRKF